jgi:hypothetical protein
MMRVSGGGTPLIILSKTAEREQGPKVQLQNINAAKVSDKIFVPNYIFYYLRWLRMSFEQVWALALCSKC